MDLVFKRYSNPFFLDLCIENNNLDSMIDTVLEQIDEEKMWELYLATVQYNEKSFVEWKESINKYTNKGNISYTKMSRKEKDATLKKADDILQNFKPPKEGGFYKC